MQYVELQLISGDEMNSSRCLQVTVFDDMITENTKYFNVLLTTNDTGVIVVAPNSTTVAIEDNDCEFFSKRGIIEFITQLCLLCYRCGSVLYSKYL